MDNRGRGAEIQRRRLRLGITSWRAFEDATGVGRATIKRAEEDHPRTAENTYLILEAWLDARELEMRSEREDAGLDAPEPAEEKDTGIFTIQMTGVRGADAVTFSGPFDKAAEVAKLASEFMWREPDQADDAS